MRFLFLLLLSFMTLSCTDATAGDRVTTARQHVMTRLGQHFGKPVFIRIIKEDWELELWMKEPDNTWHILRIYEILVEDAENDTFYALPVDAAQRDAVLVHIQQQIAAHRTGLQEEDTYEKPVYFMHSPHCLPKWRYLREAIPWLVTGLLSPFIWPGSMVTCCLFFAFGVNMGLSWLSEIEDRFCTESYMGEETHRGKRGVSIRMSGGIRCFIPWNCMAEATAMRTDCTFLRLKESQVGICLNGQDASLPIPITRHYLNSPSWLRMAAGVACLLASIIAGIVWYQLCQ